MCEKLLLERDINNISCRGTANGGVSGSEPKQKADRDINWIIFMRPKKRQADCEKKCSWSEIWLLNLSDFDGSRIQGIVRIQDKLTTSQRNDWKNMYDSVCDRALSSAEELVCWRILKSVTIFFDVTALRFLSKREKTKNVKIMKHLKEKSQ